MSAPAYVINRDFAPAPPAAFCMDRHYLLYAAKGAMRIEDTARTWSLPPARAALIAAGHEVTIALPQPLTACSVLFATDFTGPPPGDFAVFDISPLARALLLACRDQTDPDATLSARMEAHFHALAQEVWHLAAAPSRLHMPRGHSALVRRALDMTAARMADAPEFEGIARDLAVTPRTLARHFSAELGMTWRACLKRQRVIRAVEVLADSDCSVTEAAFAVGYTSLSAFNAAFRDITGQSPAQYRRSFPARE